MTTPQDDPMAALKAHINTTTHVVQTEDGTWVWWPTVNGYLRAIDLRCIADILDEKNAGDADD